MAKSSVHDVELSEIKYGDKTGATTKAELRLHKRGTNVFGRNSNSFASATASSEDGHLKFYSGSYAKQSFN